MLYLIVLCLILLAFTLGYWFGRRTGKKQGIDEGILYAPLELRRQGLQDGWCHLCGHRVVKRKVDTVVREG